VRVVTVSKFADSSWNVMAHGNVREGKLRGNWRMEWVANTLHTTSEHGVSSVLPTIRPDAHTSAASTRLNWRSRRFKWTRPFLRKTKYGFCACAIIFQLASTYATEFTTDESDSRECQKILEALEKLPKATISFTKSVCLSVCLSV
jgi:hypothetical protein